MKKLALLFCLLAVTMAAQAQFEKGKWIVNPSMTGLDFSYGKGEKVHFGLEAQGGAFLVDNVALLITAGAEWSKPQDVYKIGVGGRYYFNSCGIYLGAGLNMKRYNFSGNNDAFTNWGLGLEAGYAFFLTKTITIEPAVYYDLSFKDSDWSKFGLKVGFGFYF